MNNLDDSGQGEFFLELCNQLKINFIPQKFYYYFPELKFILIFHDQFQRVQGEIEPELRVLLIDYSLKEEQFSLIPEHWNYLGYLPNKNSLFSQRIIVEIIDFLDSNPRDKILRWTEIFRYSGLQFVEDEIKIKSFENVAGFLAFANENKMNVTVEIIFNDFMAFEVGIKDGEIFYACSADYSYCGMDAIEYIFVKNNEILEGAFYYISFSPPGFREQNIYVSTPYIIDYFLNPEKGG